VNKQEVRKKEETRPINYVEFRLQLNIPLVGLRLINRDQDILRFAFTHIVSKIETRPVAKSFYILVNTGSVDAFGIYYKDTIKSGMSFNKTELVPLIRSRKKNSTQGISGQASFIATENSDEMFFTLAFETNPTIEPDVEFSLRTRVQSLEVYYEKTCLTELLNFFKSDSFGIENVVNIKKIQENVWSKAGVIFAVENHKQFHISAELSSPYFVIPGKGTMQEPGQSIVFFLGRTLIQSDVQKKKSITHSTDVKELESNFYEKLKLNVNDVQVILVPYNINWADYLENCSEYKYKYHLLYPVSTDNILFKSIDPAYKKLPKLKIHANTPSIHLNFSDNKIIKLFKFAQNFELPIFPKYEAQTNTLSASVVSTPLNSVNKEGAKGQLERGVKKPFKNKQIKMAKSQKTDSDDDDDESDDEEWEGPFRSPKKINGKRFNLASFFIFFN